MNDKSGLNATGGLLLASAHRALGLIRQAIGYLSFTATLITGLTLVLKREFVDAALLLLASVIGPFAYVYDFAQTIVAFWDALVISPIASFIAANLNIEPPIWAIEVATLAFFAVGPVLRAIWTDRVIRRQVSQRLADYEELRHYLAGQNSQLDKLQTALASKDWKRVKAVAGMASSLALGGLGATVGRNPGHASYLITGAWGALRSSFSGFKEVQAEIDRLKSTLEQLESQIKALGAADNGLLSRLAGVDSVLAEQEIDKFVKRRMRFARALSRIALGIVSAVVLSYGIDWALGR